MGFGAFAVEIYLKCLSGSEEITSWSFLIDLTASFNKEGGKKGTNTWNAFFLHISWIHLFLTFQLPSQGAASPPKRTSPLTSWWRSATGRCRAAAAPVTSMLWCKWGRSERPGGEHWLKSPPAPQLRLKCLFFIQVAFPSVGRLHVRNKRICVDQSVFKDLMWRMKQWKQKVKKRAAKYNA